MHEFFTLSTGIHIFSRCECFGLTKQKQKIKLKTIEDIKKKVWKSDISWSDSFEYNRSISTTLHPSHKVWSWKKNEILF